MNDSCWLRRRRCFCPCAWNQRQKILRLAADKRSFLRTNETHRQRCQRNICPNDLTSFTVICSAFVSRLAGIIKQDSVGAGVSFHSRWDEEFFKHGKREALLLMIKGWFKTAESSYTSERFVFLVLFSRFTLLFFQVLKWFAYLFVHFHSPPGLYLVWFHWSIKKKKRKELFNKE